MAHPCNGVLFDRKKEWNTNICYDMMELENIMLNESESQKAIYCMIPFTQEVQNRHNYVQREQVKGSAGWRRWGKRV